MMLNFEDLRIKMVDNQLRTTDVTDKPLLQAFLDVPREKFVPSTVTHWPISMTMSWFRLLRQTLSPAI